MRVLFVEPPKEFWFVMGEYLPPPLGILQLAAFLEREVEDVDIDVLDCQASGVDWKGLEKYIERTQPDVVASSGLATCNTYTTLRALGTAKKINPDIVTITGGQHFTAMAQESLEAYSQIDIIVRGEGEETLVEVVKALIEEKSLSTVKGISYKDKEEVRHNPPRPLIKDLDDLPFPGYHFIEDLIGKYHFAMMAGREAGYALIEGSRGCPHRCTFCSQWSYWGGKWRTKSAKRIVDEMEYCHQNYGVKFFWLTDDNFNFGRRGRELCDEILKRDTLKDVTWFTQARCDDIVRNKDLLPKMRKAGNMWILLGVERHDEATLEAFNKKIALREAVEAVNLLKENDIFAQATFIIGERRDTAKSISELREFANHLDPDLAIFMILTPFPGTELYKEAKEKGWIEDWNWANYDMVHSVMPTETLTRKEIQEELYTCYKDFYGSLGRRLSALFSRNKLKRRTYRYLLKQSLLNQLRRAV